MSGVAEARTRHNGESHRSDRSDHPGMKTGTVQDQAASSQSLKCEAKRDKSIRNMQDKHQAFTRGSRNSSR